MPKSIAVVSIKGGVGKTCLTASLGVGLAKKGYEVGFLDADITSSSLHLLFDIKEEQDYIGEQFIPAKVERDGETYQMTSVAFPLGERGIQWKGKDAGDAVEQFFELSVFDSNFLLVDSPPTFKNSTSVILKKVDYALIVTAPGVLTKTDVERTIDTLRLYKTPVLGAIENYAYIKCPKCGEEYDMFAENTDLEEVEVLDRVPFIPKTEIVDINVERILEAMEEPKVLKEEEPSIKTKLLKKFLKSRVGEQSEG